MFPAQASKVLTVLGSFLLGALVAADDPPFPVRGLHLMAPSTADVPLLARFIREVLPREGVNTLVLEVNYRYRFDSHPELAGSDPLSRKEVQVLLEACRQAGVELIPLFNCLGHQSWKETTFPLLAVYPQLDETPGKYPNNEGIYCRSYCPRHPQTHAIILALLDELAAVFEARTFHVGLDEVFLLGEEECPRCRGEDPARLFAEEVVRLHRHLKERNLAMWMWGDRLLDGETTGIGKWEASLNGTHGAIDQIPRDIVICDWHYDSSPPTAGYFAIKGFSVVSSSWRKEEAALQHLEWLQLLRQAGNRVLASRALGVLHTTWTNPAVFIRAYAGEDLQELAEEEEAVRARQSAATFKRLFAALQEGSVGSAPAPR